MNCTTLLATTQSHHLPYLDISQTQQPYFELSKDLNTIHAYGTELQLQQRSQSDSSWEFLRNVHLLPGVPNLINPLNFKSRCLLLPLLGCTITYHPFCRRKTLCCWSNRLDVQVGPCGRRDSSYIHRSSDWNYPLEHTLWKTRFKLSPGTHQISFWILRNVLQLNVSLF